MYICDPSTVEETGEYPGLTVQAISRISKLKPLEETLSQKIKWRAIEEDIQHPLLVLPWLTHVYSLAHGSVHAYTHVHHHFTPTHINGKRRSSSRVSHTWHFLKTWFVRHTFYLTLFWRVKKRNLTLNVYFNSYLSFRNMRL